MRRSGLSESFERIVGHSENVEGIAVGHRGPTLASVITAHIGSCLWATAGTSCAQMSADSINRILVAGQHRGSTSAVRRVLCGLVANRTGPKTLLLRPNWTELDWQSPGSIHVSAIKFSWSYGHRGRTGKHALGAKKKTPSR